MKKSLISKILIMFSLFLGVFIYINKYQSINLHAEEIDNNSGENEEETHTHNELTFVKWSDTNSLPASSGNYYLESDVTITDTWHPKTDTKLCLNGHGIILNSEGKNVIEVPGGGNICIYDCNKLEHKYKIDSTTGLGIVDDSFESDYLTFRGGYITGAKDSPNGGAIFMPGTSRSGSTTELKMYGGTIIGNSTTGNGGAIYYAWVKRNNSLITLKDVNIIANVADGMAGGVYHGANNNFLTISGKTVIKDNISGSSPAAILEEAKLFIEGNLYIFDNKLKDGTPSDITVSHPSQKDIFSLSGALTADSKIGLDYIRRGTIYNYYPTMAYTAADKDCNELFVIHDNKIVIEEGDNLIIDYPAKDTSVPYRNIDYSIQFHNNFKPSDYEVKYGLEMGTYDLDEAPTFKELGDYTIYYKVKAGLNECEYHQTVSVVKGTPQLPKANEDLYYTGEKQELLDFSKCDDAVFEFKFEGGYWSTFIPKGLDIGEYVIYTRSPGNEHYLSYASSEETIIIVKINAPDRTDLVNSINASNEYLNSIKDKYVPVATILMEAINNAQEINDYQKSTVDDVTLETDNINQALNSAKEDVKSIDDTMSLINSIGEVMYSAESREKIDNARIKYESLSNAYKDIVSNYKTLSDAENRYNELQNDNNLASAVIEKINSIGEVTIESSEKIKVARQAYNSLTEDQKKLVTNYETLRDDENTFELILSDKSRALETDELINLIGEVQLDEASKNKIDAARTAYDALTDRQKSFITQLETLELAQTKYAALVEDKRIASTIDELINSIGNVTLESNDKILEVREAYVALTDSQKSFVTSYQVLLASETKYQELLDDVAEANRVDELINLIGEVKYNQEVRNRINNAKNAYSALTQNQKFYVKNLVILTSAEKIYNEVGVVYRQINAIGEVTSLNDLTKSQIKEARKAYDALDDSEKGLVINLDKLEQSENKYSELEKTNNISIITRLVTIIVVILVLVLIIAYISMFFIFNKWTLVNLKSKRVFKIGKKNNKLKLLRMNFKIIYREEKDVYKSKIREILK